MNENAYRVLVVVLLILILIGVVADVTLQLRSGLQIGREGRDASQLQQSGPGGRGSNFPENRNPQEDGRGKPPGPNNPEDQDVMLFALTEYPV